MPFSFRSIAILVVLVLTVSCDARENGLGPSLGNRDRTPPTVVSTVPSNEATQVSRTNAISVTFSEEMATTSMIASTFTFDPGIGGTWSYTGNTATLVPSGPLAAGQPYTATVTTAAEDRAGNNLVAPFTWTFTTGAVVSLSR